MTTRPGLSPEWLQTVRDAGQRPAVPVRGFTFQSEQFFVETTLHAASDWRSMNRCVAEALMAEAAYLERHYRMLNQGKSTSKGGDHAER